VSSIAWSASSLSDQVLKSSTAGSAEYTPGVGPSRFLSASSDSFWGAGRNAKVTALIRANLISSIAELGLFKVVKFREINNKDLFDEQSPSRVPVSGFV
jgi:hypothetical protein